MLRIGGAFTVVDGARVHHRLTPTAPNELGPALGLFGAVVRSAKAFDGGKLEIVFNDDQRLDVESDPDYEAWEIVAPGGMRAICAPGGEVAVWQPNEVSIVPRE